MEKLVKYIFDYKNKNKIFILIKKKKIDNLFFKIINYKN